MNHFVTSLESRANLIWSPAGDNTYASACDTINITANQVVAGYSDDQACGILPITASELGHLITGPILYKVGSRDL